MTISFRPTQLLITTTNYWILPTAVYFDLMWYIMIAVMTIAAMSIVNAATMHCYLVRSCAKLVTWLE